MLAWICQALHWIDGLKRLFEPSQMAQGLCHIAAKHMVVGSIPCHDGHIRTEAECRNAHVCSSDCTLRNSRWTKQIWSTPLRPLSKPCVALECARLRKVKHRIYQLRNQCDWWEVSMCTHTQVQIPRAAKLRTDQADSYRH